MHPRTIAYKCTLYLYCHHVIEWFLAKIPFKKREVKNPEHKELSRKKAECFFFLPIKQCRPFWYVWSKQRFGRHFVSSQGNCAGRQTAEHWKEREDSMRLFFSVMCNKRMILFCNTLDVKALILEHYISTNLQLSILQPTTLCPIMGSRQANIILPLYISKELSSPSPFRFIFILLLETLSCWRLLLSLWIT